MRWRIKGQSDIKVRDNFPGPCMMWKLDFLYDIDQLILQRKHLVHIGPWISNNIAGVSSSCLNVDAVGQERIVHRASWARSTGDHSEYQLRKFVESRDIDLGVCHKEGVISGRSLFKGGHFFETDACENDLIVEQTYIIGGTAVGHVRNTQTPETGWNIGAAHVGYFCECDTAGVVEDHHGHPLAGNERQCLLVEDRSIGAADCYSMETVCDRNVIGYGSKGGS